MGTSTYESYLVQAAQKARAIQEHPDYSAEARQRKAQEARADGVATARQVAQDMLDMARRRVERSNEALVKAHADADKVVNWPKLTAVMQEVQAQAQLAGDWSVVRQMVDAAQRDPEAIRAWRNIGIRELQRRSHTELDKLAVRPDEIIDVQHFLDERAQALEPEGLRAARANLAAAEENLQQVTVDVKAVNRTWDAAGISLNGGGVFGDILGETGIFGVPNAGMATTGGDGGGGEQAG